MKNQQAKKLKTYQNKYQHKLIVLTSTINYTNQKHKKYTQNNLLYYFNGNLKRNGGKETTIKTLQKYLYQLNKELKITNNYYRHLGVNMGTEVYYELKYPKKECHRLINEYFKVKKEEKFQKRVNDYLKIKYDKKRNVEKSECNNNNNNNKEKEEEKLTSKIEDLQTKKYARKCNFKTNLFLQILNLNLKKIQKFIC